MKAGTNLLRTIVAPSISSQTDSSLRSSSSFLQAEPQRGQMIFSLTAAFLGSRPCCHRLTSPPQFEQVRISLQITKTMFPFSANDERFFHFSGFRSPAGQPL